MLRSFRQSLFYLHKQLHDAIFCFLLFELNEEGKLHLHVENHHCQRNRDSNAVSIKAMILALSMDQSSPASNSPSSKIPLTSNPLKLSNKVLSSDASCSPPCAPQTSDQHPPSATQPYPPQPSIMQPTSAAQPNPPQPFAIQPLSVPQPNPPQAFVTQPASAPQA